jgi:hypothetical protein
MNFKWHRRKRQKYVKNCIIRLASQQQGIDIWDSSHGQARRAPLDIPRYQTRKRLRVEALRAPSSRFVLRETASIAL